MTVLNYLERERGIQRATLIEAIEFALQSAAKRSMGTSRDVRVVVDPQTCDIITYQTLIVSDDVKGVDFIPLVKAKLLKPDAQLGDAIEIKAQPKDFGRIAAQAAKQAVLTKLRQAERDVVYDEFRERVGDIVTGVVKGIVRGDLVVDIGRTEATLPSKERVPSEDFQPGERIRAYLLKVQNTGSAPAVTLSRSAPEFVKALFCLEVAEISDGIVEVKGVSRDAGYRTKIAVAALDEKVDPVGACVGLRGIRIRNIVREIGGEKIDVVRWSTDIRIFATDALQPAKIEQIWLDERDPRLLHVIVAPDQYTLAIGRRGQNVRLASQLTGYRIDVEKTVPEATFEEKLAKTIKTLAAIEDIGADNAKALAEKGFLTLEGIVELSRDEFSEAAGFDPETAHRIWDAASVATDDEPANGAKEAPTADDGAENDTAADEGAAEDTVAQEETPEA